jgi:hypothetical protein
VPKFLTDFDKSRCGRDKSTLYVLKIRVSFINLITSLNDTFATASVQTHFELNAVYSVYARPPVIYEYVPSS